MKAEELFRIFARIVAAFTLGVAGSTAQAALYRVGLDPSFGNPYPFIFYEGLVQIDVGNELTCLTSVGIRTSGDCGGFNVQSASVTFFRDPAAPQTFSFTTGLGLNAAATALVENLGSGNQITGFNVDLIGPNLFNITGLYPEFAVLPLVALELTTTSTTSCAGSDPNSFNCKGFLLVENVGFIYPNPNEPGQTVTCTPPSRTITVPDFEGGTSDVEFCRAENAARQTVTRIPEPGTLGLLFGALSAGWLIRRERQAAR